METNLESKRCFEDGANSIHKIKANYIFLYCFWRRMEQVNEAEIVLQVLESLQD